MIVRNMMKPPLLLALLMTASLQSWTQNGLKTRTPYHLQPNDGLQIKYRYTPQYDETVRVQPDGSAWFQLAGHLPLAGHTLEEARALILNGIGGKLVDPQIDLELASFEKPYFVVAGQVTTPGRYDMAGANVSVIEAIAQAGGFRPSSKNTEVFVYHKVGVDLVLGYTLNCKKMMQHPTSEIASMTVESGDVIVVPQNKISSIERGVKIANPGLYYPLP